VTVVLDASAVVALVGEEPGCDRAAAALDDSVIGAVNLAEVAGALAAKGKSEVQVRAALRSLELAVIEADEELAIDAGLLRRVTAPFGLSLGDRFCLALARRLRAPAVTADRAWAAIGEACDVEVRLIR
jgi:ribonuclease VapC